MKYIRIKSCWTCPFRYSQIRSEPGKDKFWIHYCENTLITATRKIIAKQSMKEHHGIDVPDRDEPVKIPKWCPLEDETD